MNDNVSPEADEKPRLLVVEARFYDDIANLLLQGASRALEKAGAAFDRVSVPGSLEIPDPPALSAAGPGCLGLAGHDQLHDQPFLAVGTGVELTVDDLSALVLQAGDGPRPARVSAALD